MSKYAAPHQIADALESLEWKGCSIGHKVILANAVAALRATQPAAGEPVEIEVPTFSPEGMGCGLEDRGITDRYEAMEYGYNEALEQQRAIINSHGPLFSAPPAAAHGASEEHRNQMADTIVSLRTEIAALRRNAAAHGDEAATLVKALSLLWKTTNFLPRGGSLDGRVSAFLAQHAPEPVASAAAMRAQGEGGAA